MIEVFFYLGYAVGVLSLIALLIAICVLIFFKLLDFKKIRELARDIILMNDIKVLSDDDYLALQIQMQRTRKKWSQKSEQ